MESMSQQFNFGYAVCFMSHCCLVCLPQNREHFPKSRFRCWDKTCACCRPGFQCSEATIVLKMGEENINFLNEFWTENKMLTSFSGKKNVNNQLIIPPEEHNESILTCIIHSLRRLWIRGDYEELECDRICVFEQTSGQLLHLFCSELYSSI